MTFFSKLNSIMRQDFGSRGLMKALPEADLDLVSRELAQARRVLILTGFPVICPDQTVTGETDGPLGTADLAFALEANGCQVMAVTDCHSSAILKAALSVRCREARIAVIPETGAESFAEDLLDAFSPTHVVTLERPGKACDGHYHNMRGIVIDSMTADADCFLSLAREKNICTISIGDGGNEMGMGAFRKEIDLSFPLAAKSALSRVPTMPWPAEYLTGGESEPPLFSPEKRRNFCFRMKSRKRKCSAASFSRRSRRRHRTS